MKKSQRLAASVTDHLSAITLAALEIELSDILGRKADLRTPNELNRYFRDEILTSAVMQYVA